MAAASYVIQANNIGVQLFFPNSFIGNSFTGTTTTILMTDPNGKTITLGPLEIDPVAGASAWFTTVTGNEFNVIGTYNCQLLVEGIGEQITTTKFQIKCIANVVSVI